MVKKILFEGELGKEMSKKSQAEQTEFAAMTKKLLGSITDDDFVALENFDDRKWYFFKVKHPQTQHVAYMGFLQGKEKLYTAFGFTLDDAKNKAQTIDEMYPGKLEL